MFAHSHSSSGLGLRLAVLASLATCVVGPSATAQVVEARKLAAEGAALPNASTWETDIASAPDPVSSENDVAITVYHLADGPTRIGFGIARKNHLGTWQWQQEGIIPPPSGTIGAIFDPTIAFNSVTGDYVVVGVVVAEGGGRLGWSHYFPRRAPFSGGWAYTTAYPNIDRPSIVPGRMDSSQQEFYYSGH